MAVEWRKDIEIGIAEIDNQHKELFRRVDLLLDACNQGKGKQEVKSTMDYLQEYVIVHFNAEERFQIECSYPKYESHKQQHESFVKEYEKLKEKHEKVGNTTDLVVLLNRILVEWLVFHINRSDKDIAVYLKERESL